MAHIHLEDGTLPLHWVLIWALVAAIVVAACLYWLRNVRRADSRLIVLASMLTAATFAVFQFEIPPFGVHLSLTPFVGILAGPAMGTIIMLIVNIFSAGIGHEGWTIIAPNLLINLTEVAGGWLLYHALGHTRLDIRYRAGIATFAGLFLGNAAMVAIIMASGVTGIEEVQLSHLSVIIAANLLMALVEAFVTAYIVAYIGKVKPDMLGTGFEKGATGLEKGAIGGNPVPKGFPPDSE